MGMKNLSQGPPEKIALCKVVCMGKDDDLKVKFKHSGIFGPKPLSNIFFGYVLLLLQMSPPFQR